MRRAAAIAKRSRLDVIRSIRDEKGKCRESVENLLACLRPRKALKELLQYQAGCEDQFPGLKRLGQREDFGDGRRFVPPQRKRPDIGVNERAQSRERSDLES